MNKLYICGDSFSAVSKILPGTHWSELLAEKLGWQLVNYARRGCSNGGIRLQIEQAIQDKADFIFIVPTGWDRTEIPVSDNFYQGPTNVIKSFGNFLQDWLLDQSKSCYDPGIGVKNINYSHSEHNKMIFETIFSLAENYDHEYRKDRLSDEKHQAIKSFVNHIYDSGWKNQLDRWIISSGAFRCHDAGIPFSIENGMLWENKQEVQKDLASQIQVFIRILIIKMSMRI